MKGRAVVAAMAMAMVGLPAAATEIPKGGLTIQEVQSWLQKGGYKASLDKTDDGEAIIASAAEGVNFDIYMYDCVSERCASIQFSAGFTMDDPLTTAKANEWNSKKRYAKAYLDSDGNPYLTYDANLSPGGTYEALDDDFGVWRNMTEDFTDFIDW